MMPRYGFKSYARPSALKSQRMTLAMKNAAGQSKFQKSARFCATETVKVRAGSPFSARVSAKFWPKVASPSENWDCEFVSGLPFPAQHPLLAGQSHDFFRRVLHSAGYGET